MAAEHLLDAEQMRFMQDDHCIVIDERDVELRSASKKEVHFLHPILAGQPDAPAGKAATLHRAFSVFLFDEHEALLLQQRAASKITYPLHWTNTCCSHPLWCNAERGGVTDEARGVRNAAARKLRHELGLEVQPEDLQFVTRIIYSAPNHIPSASHQLQLEQEEKGESENNEHRKLPNAEEAMKYGEHELDYILIGRIARRTVESSQINPGEVVRTCWMRDLQEMRALIEQNSQNTATASDATPRLKLITPWVRKLWSSGWLHKIWRHLGDVSAIQNWQQIERL